MTATQLKGRELDRGGGGAGDAAPCWRTRRWRQPAFLTQRPPGRREIGTATICHAIPPAEACGSQAGVEAELSRHTGGRLPDSPARPGAVNRQWIGDFFRTELGQRLQRARMCCGV